VNPKVLAGALLLCAISVSLHAQSPIGIFENHADVGAVLHPGSVDYDAKRDSYTITASGANIWSREDDFHFLWKKLPAGDLTMTASVAFLDTNPNPSEHRKAVVMLRQSLDPDSPYIDVAQHGNAIAALQYRDEKGGLTNEIQSNITNPKRVRLLKRGDYVYMALAGDDGVFHPAAGWIRIPFSGPFYAGIGVSAHNKDFTEKAVFTNVEITAGSPPASAAPILYSSLETLSPTNAAVDRTVIYSAAEHFEAPNWTHDGASILFNRDGRLVKIPADGKGAQQIIDTGFAIHCNNDHGISPDSKWLAISDTTQADHKSQIYILPIAGGTPRQITKNSPSYWHGWSPDGKTLAFAGVRDGDFDIFTIPVAGGDETRLTTTKGTDDGPEYSLDGQYIYFNSVRTGLMQIWRMHPDGAAQEQVFSDDYNNWFPHFSPDGKWMVFLSYDKSVTGHPPNQDVLLRVMSMDDKKITVLARLFGGQGTINVPSWSPDSKRLAFVSYQLIPDEK